MTSNTDRSVDSSGLCAANRTTITATTVTVAYRITLSRFRECSRLGAVLAHGRRRHASSRSLYASLTPTEHVAAERVRYPGFAENEIIRHRARMGWSAGKFGVDSAGSYHIFSNFSDAETSARSDITNIHNRHYVRR